MGSSCTMFISNSSIIIDHQGIILLGTLTTLLFLSSSDLCAIMFIPFVFYSSLLSFEDTDICFLLFCFFFCFSIVTSGCRDFITVTLFLWCLPRLRWQLFFLLFFSHKTYQRHHRSVMIIIIIADIAYYSYNYLIVLNLYQWHCNYFVFLMHLYVHSNCLFLSIE